MKTEMATFGMGCFWGPDALFRAVPGVVSTRVGYSGGTVSSPSYEQVCTGATGHAEAVEIVFDPAVISYAQLLDLFWHNHNPTTIDQQGPDYGSQYRSVIFYHSPSQKQQA
jgi:peptide-methionine (S)-S-oxide reductase